MARRAMRMGQGSGVFRGSGRGLCENSEHSTPTCAARTAGSRIACWAPSSSWCRPTTSQSCVLGYEHHDRPRLAKYNPCALPHSWTGL